MGDRTGVISSIIAPLLIVLAGRNNALLWLTGWHYATFVTYHKWVARVLVALVVVHAICFSISFQSTYRMNMAKNNIVWGTVGTVSGGLLLGLLLMQLRRRWYEVFLAIHIALAALFIAGAWIHVNEMGYVWFYYASVAVWVFDRVVRIVRLVGFGCPKSEVTLLANETLRIVVPKPKYWLITPGGHAFVHFMRPSCFWQSHPFTFTSMRADESSGSKDSVVLYCKVKGGITHGLYQYLSTHPGKRAQIRVALEGPYGDPTPAKRYDSAVFVAGGNGIPGIYSEVYDLALQSRMKDQTLKLLWVIKEYKSLCWFYEELLSLKDTNIQCTIFVTQPHMDSCMDDFSLRFPSRNSNDEKLDEKSIKGLEVCSSSDSSMNGVIDQIHSELSHIDFNEGRPNIDGLVKQEIEDSRGSVAFVTCGHPLMVDDIRYSVAHSLDYSKGKRVDFFEQLQVWS